MADADRSDKRWRISVQGVVQGVGFRPFVYACATRLGLVGFVNNRSSGVRIEIEGPAEALAGFRRALLESPPPLARIEAVDIEEIPPAGEAGFRILESQSLANAHTLVSPDIALCDDCLRELFAPADRRHRYPFINCTNCGPRFTIQLDIPYDRPATTMASFTMCPPCRAEYENPLDRRFHAQPNACPQCGPRATFARGEVECEGEAALVAAQRAMRAGEIVAVKGIGGFHLACDARNDRALALLRERKGRIDKPFAVMARDLATARRFAEIDDAERDLLASRERPIVLLRKGAGGGLSPAIAPGNDYIGVMLPYSPLHHLLLNSVDPACADLDALVMTSGNLSDEPIARENDEARERLAGLADAFLLHDRGIHAPCDDSVIRVFAGRELPLRRSRGYAPFPVRLPFSLCPTLGVGGELKNAFCLLDGEHAILSQHIGDMENLETLRAFEDSIARLERLFRIEPELIAVDRHPRYLSSQWARARFAPPRLVEVQHHHAHIAAVMAEHGLDGAEPVLGFSFDGTGYGDDGTIWGGEVLRADYRGCERLAHLRYFPLPGGDAAIKRPYRAALAALWAAGIEWDERLAPVAACPPTERAILRKQLESDLNCTSTSSMGRLFDAAAALAGVRQAVTYEAQAAIEFEALADDSDEAYEFAIEEGPILRIDPAPLLRAIVADVRRGAPVARIASRFHNAAAELILRLALRLGTHRRIALSGGVFQNVTLLRKTTQRLTRAGFDALSHRLVPPNDGGLALGQAVIANFANTTAATASRRARPRCH